MEVMIEGFSKLNKKEKIKAIGLDEKSNEILKNATVSSTEISDIINELSENTISHFPFPYGIAPNLLVNGKYYNFPLVTEESSVVAAIAKAAKFWSGLGGFKTKVINTVKVGHVHFFWYDDFSLLKKKFESLKEFITLRTGSLNRKMKRRGGGLLSIELIDKSSILENYGQLELTFDTQDAMGANFINSVLEETSKSFKQFVSCDQGLNAYQLKINMAILSNYTPNSKAMAYLEAPVIDINAYGKRFDIKNYTEKFIQAINIAKADVSRAVTNNKGIYNGIDALAIATGNDWRAIEACGHAYASRNGQYGSLTDAIIKNDKFIFSIEMPITVGVVGGITNLHPMAKLSLKILNNPSAEELMQFMAVVGLASNFSAIDALITQGIQKGHMKMHLSNILNQLGANHEQKQLAKGYFNDKTVSFTAVQNWLSKLKNE